MKKLLIGTLPILYIFILVTISGCENNKFSEVPESDFIGKWELHGRSLFNGIQIEITEIENNFVGKVIKLNDEKIIKMFVEVGDIWVLDIKRNSNFEFTLTEKRIASQLFGLYGQSTTESFQVQFIDKNTIALAKEGKDPKNSKVFYKRID
jgi:hypothetical protein